VSPDGRRTRAGLFPLFTCPPFYEGLLRFLLPLAPSFLHRPLSKFFFLPVHRNTSCRLLNVSRSRTSVISFSCLIGWFHLFERSFVVVFPFSLSLFFSFKTSLLEIRAALFTFLTRTSRMGHHLLPGCPLLPLYSFFVFFLPFFFSLLGANLMPLEAGPVLLPRTFLKFVPAVVARAPCNFPFPS